MDDSREPLINALGSRVANSVGGGTSKLGRSSLSLTLLIQGPLAGVMWAGLAGFLGFIMPWSYAYFGTDGQNALYKYGSFAAFVSAYLAFAVRAPGSGMREWHLIRVFSVPL